MFDLLPQVPVLGAVALATVVLLWIRANELRRATHRRRDDAFASLERSAEHNRTRRP